MIKLDRLTFVSYGVKVNSHTVLISHLVLLLKEVLQCNTSTLF